MQTLALPKLIDGALHVDASFLEGRFMRCPREAYYYKCLSRETADTQKAYGRLYGNWLHHHMLAPHHRGTPPHQVRTDMETAWLKSPPFVDETDYRTLEYTLELYDKYCEQYETEPFDVYRSSSGEPAVELAFAEHIWDIDLPNGPVPVIYTGRVDLVVQRHTGGLSVSDHKSSKIGGSTFWEQWRNSTQLHGYVWAARRITGLDISTFEINALFVRPPTRTGVKHELERQIYSIGETPEDRMLTMEAWLANVQATLQNLQDCISTRQWPMHTNACVGRYGCCEYLDTCRISPGHENLITTNLYRDVTWNPLDPQE